MIEPTFAGRPLKVVETDTGKILVDEGDGWKPAPIGQPARVIYLAGPMRRIPEFNFPAFRAAREALRAQGHIVLCPAERDERNGFDPTGLAGTEDLSHLGFDLADALYHCFTDVLTCDTIALLPGWTRSEGARAEALVANLTGRDVALVLPNRGHRLVLVDLRISTKAELVARPSLVNELAGEVG